MQNRICLIYNYAQHYRSNIFSLMDKELSIDFVFGDKYLDIKKLDYSILENFKKEVKNIRFIKKPLYYQIGVIKMLNEDYSTYLILGEPTCISTWIILILNKFYKKKIFLWSHGWYGKESKFKRIIKRIFFSLSDGIFLYGNYAKNLMIKEKINENKLHVIYNSLNYDQQLFLRNNLKTTNIYKNKFNNNYYNLIFIGRLTEIKRIDMLIYATQKLKSQSVNCNIILIGTGEKMNSLKNLVQELKMEDSVWFYGPCYNELELSELIYNADLCISPGNVGLTAMHSLAYGTPVITHNDFSHQMPEFEAIEDGVSGAFFKTMDYNSLAESIYKWFSENKDRTYIRERCYNIIDTKYNPHVQLETFRTHLSYQ